jgi:uncharacterized Fe-S cluster-containing radical SAM superfamily protein
VYDPLRLSGEIESAVVKEVEDESHRKYYRFRPTRFYGGIASADCCGCNLRCYFCWSSDRAREGRMGSYFSPKEVVDRLVEIAQKFKYDQLRITGNEPTIARAHLIAVLRNIPSSHLFILETNGILLGADESYVGELAKFDNLHVRISLKGCTEVEFSKLTGAVPGAFQLQLKALKFCVERGISCHPAVLIDLVRKDNLEILRDRLSEIDRKLVGDLEFETLIAYPHVVRRLRAVGLWK